MKKVIILIVISLFMFSCDEYSYTYYVTYENGDKEYIYTNEPLHKGQSMPNCLFTSSGSNSFSVCGVRSFYLESKTLINKN